MAKVLLDSSTGPTRQLGSGLLAGIPINSPNDGNIVTTIPDRFLEDIGFNFERAGGAGWPEPHRGFVFSLEEYQYRFLSALSHYRTARKFNAEFCLVVDDLWGIDQPPFIHPGDNGDWSLWDSFLGQLVSDIKSHEMSRGLTIDVWNEPDNHSFWKRDQKQYLEMWDRTFKRLKSELSDVLIAGPSTEYGPGDDNLTFSAWAQFVAATDTIPDTYTWHAIYAERSPTAEAEHFDKERVRHKLPEGPININEYLGYSQIGPGIVVWYLSQFERLNIRGCRANWAKGGESPHSFHHLLANLLGPKDLVAPYYTNGEYQAYKYYASMRGERVQTVPPLGHSADLFAVIDSGRSMVKIFTGTRSNMRKFTVTVSGFNSVGLSGSISRKILYFGWKGLFGEVLQPRELGIEVHEVENDSISFTVIPTSFEEAYAFELF